MKEEKGLGEKWSSSVEANWMRKKQKTNKRSKNNNNNNLRKTTHTHKKIPPSCKIREFPWELTSLHLYPDFD